MKVEITKLPASALTNLNSYQKWTLKMINARIERKQGKVWLHYDRPEWWRIFDKPKELKK